MLYKVDLGAGRLQNFFAECGKIITDAARGDFESTPYGMVITTLWTVHATLPESSISEAD